MGGDFEFRGTDRFEVLTRLGQGGMGVVYEVYDRQTNTRAALKTLRSTNAESLLRFKDEFRAIQNIKHANLVQLRELIQEAGQWYFTMELVDGANFLQYVRGEDDGAPPSGTFAPADALRAAAVKRMWERGDAPTTNFDELKLRTALPQLVSGLMALHRAHKIHRDIKPSNVMVTRKGRVVLLDFGFIFDVVDKGHTTDGIVVGTADYMAPEQAAGRAVGPAADWYALGVVLYRALTGRLPFSGSRMEVLTRKQQVDPPPPRFHDPEVPEDLDALCMDLLRIDPRRRATGAQVLDRLGATASALDLSSQTEIQPFVGRADELQALSAAFADVVRGSSVVVYLTGESGVGKSALVSRFFDTVVSDEPGAVALAGRCHERESVPYKAVDEVIDELSLAMRRLAADQAAALLPLNIGLVAQVFPTLRRVEVIAQAPPPRSEVMDPLESRRRMFAAVRELFGRLAERRPTVVWIDDLQWADGDSLALLRELLQQPDAPPMLLIASARSETGAGADAARAALPTLADETYMDARHLHLGGLSDAEGRKLAAMLLGDRPGAEAIAREAQGHPLFIDELVRHAVVVGERAGELPDLEAALWERIGTLDAVARSILETVSVAGAPLAQQVAASAAEIDYGTFCDRVGQLRDEKLVRTTGTRRDDDIEPYHGRVASAVLAHMPPDAQAGRHQRLALGLEASGGDDVEALAIHWHGAGDLERAAHYALDAAARAAGALAFDRAARLYRDALVWGSAEGVQARRIRTRLGDALANAGRGMEAAQAYLTAAQGSSAAAALELKRMAADQLLRSGHIDEGLAALGEVLEVTGMSLDVSERRALLALRVGRGRLKVRGLGFKERDATQVSLEDLTHIDIAWSVSSGLVNVDYIRGAAYQTRHMLLALDAGEPYRVCRALVADALYEAADGESSRRRTAKLLERAGEIAGGLDSDHARGLTRLAHGITGVHVGAWRAALRDCDEAEGVLRDRCTNVWWERNSAHVYSHWALALLGEIAELTARVPRRLREAEDRGDLYAATNLRSGLPNLVWLAAGDAAAARREADEALRRWSRRGFHVQHYYDLLAQAQIDLYEGDARRAHERIAERWADLERSMLLRVQLVRCLLHHLRARAAVATGDDALVKEAARDARRLAGEASWAAPLGLLIDAGCAATRRDDAGARDALERAIAGLQGAEMHLFAALARRRLAGVLGGDQGAALAADARATLDSEGVADPARLAAVLVPGFPD